MSLSISYERHSSPFLLPTGVGSLSLPQSSFLYAIKSSIQIPTATFPRVIFPGTSISPSLHLQIYPNSPHQTKHHQTLVQSEAMKNVCMYHPATKNTTKQNQPLPLLLLFLCQCGKARYPHGRHTHSILWFSSWCWWASLILSFFVGYGSVGPLRSVSAPCPCVT